VAHKDVSTLKTIPFSYRDTLIQLMQCAGPAKSALAAMERLDLPESARSQCRDLQDVINILSSNGSTDWTLSVDATENRGLAYHSGISFSIFVPGVSSEVGRGGRYRVDGQNQVADSEATGFTLYVDTLRDILPSAKPQKRLFIDDGITNEEAARLRSEGYVTVYALSEYGRGETEAKRLGCQFIWTHNSVKALA
jgi:ATP phosphoribosyltransferase regulatory subunit